MPSPSQDLVPVFIPALVVVLVHAEDKKTTPLTKEEVYAIRDSAICIMMEAKDAERMAESRGYHDIDPENCWHDWQMARREMGRKPAIEPGPYFHFVDSNDEDYQQTIQQAQKTLPKFCSMLPSDGAPRPEALIKIKLVQGEHQAFIWLNDTTWDGNHFTAKLFELPDTLSQYDVGDSITVSPKDLLDWMVNENGKLHGGFSLRYHRSRLSPSAQTDFDSAIGVSEYI